MTFPVLWLTGNTGAGKTTLASGFQKKLNGPEARGSLARRVIVLDGNEMRRTISNEEKFSRDDRRKHNLRVARLAEHLRSQGFLVVVAVIAPFESVRREIDEICAPVWVYLKRDGLNTPDRPYEEPEKPDLTLDIDKLNRAQALARLQKFIRKIGP